VFYGKIRKGASQMNKEKHFSAEHRRKISEANMGHPSWTKGMKHTDEAKRKVSEAKKGKKRAKFSEAWLKSMSESHKKSARTKAHLKKIHQNMFGENNHGWKGGITKKNHTIRTSAEFRLWRKTIFEFDNFTCQCCGQHGGDLHPHHIFNFADFPEQRLNIENGITLCIACHREFHERHGWRNNTKEQLIEFFQSMRKH
jgi:hypothetical protein